MKLILIFFLLFIEISFAKDLVKLNKFALYKSEILANKLISTCLVDENTKAFKIEFTNFVNGIKSTQFVNIASFVQMSNILKNLKCNQKLQSDLNWQIKKDIMPFTRSVLDQNKDLVLEFKEKGLNYTHHLLIYDSFKKLLEVEYLDDHILLKEARKNLNSISTRPPETCTDSISLSREEIFEGPKDQKKIGWCYAFSASELLSFKLKKKISPSYVALNYNDNFLFNLFDRKEGGFVGLSIEGVKENGICTSSINPYEENPDYSNGIFEIYKMIESLKQNEMSEDMALKEICHNPLLQNAFSNLFPNVNFKEITNVLFQLNQNEGLKEIAKLNCKPEKSLELENIEVESITFHSDKFKIIDEQLNKKNIVAISYDHNVLFSPIDKNLLPDHASVLIGRRFNQKTKSCEYLLKNSAGKNCDIYLPYFQCEFGYLWIPEEYFKLNSSIFNVTYIK